MATVKSTRLSVAPTVPNFWTSHANRLPGEWCLSHQNSPGILTYESITMSYPVAGIGFVMLQVSKELYIDLANVRSVSQRGTTVEVFLQGLPEPIPIGFADGDAAHAFLVALLTLISTGDPVIDIDGATATID